MSNYAAEYIRLASELTRLWNAMPPVVDDDFPEAKFNFENAIRAFRKHILPEEQNKFWAELHNMNFSVLFPPKPGHVCRHHKGNVYTVLSLANMAIPSDKFPPMVVYMGANGNIWCRPLSSFMAKFTLMYDGQMKVT